MSTEYNPITGSYESSDGSGGDLISAVGTGVGSGYGNAASGTPPSSGGSASDNSAYDWASLLSGFGLGAIKLATAGSAPPVTNRGIPTSKTALAPAATSKYTGYFVLAAIGLLLLWAFRRVRR